MYHKDIVGGGGKISPPLTPKSFKNDAKKLKITIDLENPKNLKKRKKFVAINIF